MPDDKKRLLIFAGGYYPTLGGGEFANRKLAEAALREGMQVRIVTLTDTPLLGETRDPAGVPVRYVRGYPFLNQRLIAPSVIFSEIRRFDPHIVQFNGPTLHDIYGALIARALGKPVVALYHADFRDDRAISRTATALYGHTVFPLSKRVFTSTNAYQMRLIARGNAARKIVNIGMGVDTERFSPSNPPADTSAPLRLLFVGRLDRNHTYKRADLLLQAVALLRERGRQPHAVLVGDGDSKSALEQLARDLNIADCVEFAGNTDEDALLRRYRQGHILVLPSPSASEGFGMVILEAMACGIPVVTSEMAGGAEAVRASGVGALWNGEHVRSLVEAVEKTAATATEKSEEIGRRARAFVEEHHTWQSVGKRLLAAYRSVLEKSA